MVYRKPWKWDQCHFSCKCRKVYFLAARSFKHTSETIPPSTQIPMQKALVGGVKYGPIAYFSLSPLPVKKVMPIYATSKDITASADACSPLPANTPDLSKFVVIIRRGTCAFVSPKSLDLSPSIAKYLSSGNETAECCCKGCKGCTHLRVWHSFIHSPPQPSSSLPQ